MAEDEKIPEADGDYYSYRSECIASCYNAIAAVDGMDGKVTGKAMERKITAIKEMSLEMLFEFVKEMHEETFPKE